MMAAFPAVGRRTARPWPWIASVLVLRCAPVEVVAPARDTSATLAAESPGASPAVAGESSPRGARDSGEPARDLMQFIGIGRGERVADVGVGDGDTIRRMAEAVGPSGVVYTRHDPRRLSAPAKPGASTEHEGILPENVVLMSTPDSAPFSAVARDLDLVTILFSYADLVAQGRDRLVFNRAVFAALAPERFYIIAAHGRSPASSAPGEGQVDEALVRRDVEAAGFVFVEAAWLAPSTEPSDVASTRYVLKFRRPK
ncbi:MAG TPA: hypothetical protein VMG12_05235 [Polyangiaceae bacterium]|nr:hypothetical protein [Polyangiaceae bacterium]